MRGRGPTRAAQLLANAGCTAEMVLRAYRTPAARAKWLAERQRSLGASDVPAALGVPGAYTSRFALWWSKQPGAPVPNDDDMPEELEWGLRLEQAIADKFADVNPGLEVVRPPGSLYRSAAAGWATCSPDRLVFTYGEDPWGPPIVAPLELKTDQNGDRWDDVTFPAAYRVQLMWQCFVFGVRVGYLAALIGKRYREYRVEFDQAEIDETVAAADEFWRSLKGEAPDVDGHDSTRAVLLRLNADPDADLRAWVPDELADEYRAATAEAAASTARLKLAKNRLLAGMGSAGVAVDMGGRLVAQRRRYRNPGYTVDPFDVDGLWPITGKGARP